VLASRFISCSRKVHLLAHFAALVEQADKMLHVRIQPDQFFLDVAAIDQHGHFLQDPFFVHLCAEQFLHARLQRSE
jgi:hypothetical protein